MKHISSSLADLMKLAALLIFLAFWSSGSLHAASDVKHYKSAPSNSAKPATSTANEINVGTSQMSSSGPAFPDLVIQRVSTSPVRPTTRDAIRLSAVVKNTGGAASRMCQMEIKVGGEAAGHRVTVPALAPRQAYTAIRRVTLPVAMRYRSILRIDVDDRNRESSEANNEKTYDFTVHPEPRPDLVIQRMIVSPENPATTDAITLTVVVKNIGDMGSRSCQLKIKAGGEGWSPNYPVPVLPAGGTHIARRTLTLPVASTYRSTATVDVDDRNQESDERNNQGVLDFVVH